MREVVLEEMGMDEKKKEERARLLELVERTLKEIEETREALLAEIAGREKR